MTRLGPFAGLGWKFTVSCSAGPMAQQVARALSSLRVDSDESGLHEYSLVAPGASRGSLAVDGDVLLESRSEWALYARLLWHINVGTIDATTDHVLLHAAAAERDGRAVVLCAPMESGKTTLVAGLVLAGLRYLTDEAVAIRPADGCITPFPKALSVDHGSWSLLSRLRPDLPGDAEHLRGSQWQVSPADIRADAVSSGATPAVVVLPRYLRGATTVVEPLTPGAAMVEVLQETFALDRQRERDMIVLAGVLSRCPAYRLTVGGLDEAVEAVLRLL